MKPSILAFLVLAILLPSTPAGADDEAAQVPRYGDRGQVEVAVMLAAGSGGLGVGAGGRYFVLSGVAPGVEADVYRYSGRTFGDVFGTLRLVPLRLQSFALAVTGKAGRFFISNHDSGFGLGGGISALFMTGNVGFEIGFEILRLLPEKFCMDLQDCTVTRPVLGIRIVF